MNKKKIIIFFTITSLIISALLLTDINISRKLSEQIRIWLLLSGVSLVIFWSITPKRVRVALLIALSFLCTFNYLRFGDSVITDRLNSYDVLHYYLSAKYFDNVGYYNLYPAMILADKESGPFSSKIHRYRYQDADGYQKRSIPHALKEGKKIKSEKFTPQEWKEFVHDFKHIQRDFQLTKHLWKHIITDRGFNGTTVWIMLFRPIAKIFPVEYIKLLSLTDIAFLGIALFLVARTYSLATALWGLIFFTTTFSLRWAMPGTMFFRYDWVALLMLAMVFLKRNKNYISGACIGLASLIKLFPVAWIFLLALKGGIELTGKKLNKGLLKIAAGFVICVIAFQGAALISVGYEPAKTHIENIKTHIDPMNLSPQRLGFSIAYNFKGTLNPKQITTEQKREIATQSTQRNIIAVFLILLIAIGARKMSNDKVFALGFLPYFLLSAGSYYYAVARITLIVLHASDLSKIRNKIGLIILLSLEVFCHWSVLEHSKHRAFLIGYLGWGLTIYSFMMMVWLLIENKPAIPEKILKSNYIPNIIQNRIALANSKK